MDNDNIFTFENLENEELLPVTLDIVFKEVFGQDDSKPILQSFLNAALNLNIKVPGNCSEPEQLRAKIQ